MTKQVTCTSSRNFLHALRYGDIYDLIAYDADKNQYQVIGYNGRKRWFPAYCFREGALELPLFESYLVDESGDYDDQRDVTLFFSDNTRRWFVLATLEFIREVIANNEPHFYQHEHTIIVESLEKADLDAILTELQNQGRLMAVTMPLEDCEDDEVEDDDDLAQNTSSS